jgi:outer membrane protein assembly factor BamB
MRHPTAGLLSILILTLAVTAAASPDAKPDTASGKRAHFFTDPEASWTVYKGDYARTSAVEADLTPPFDLAWKRKAARSIGSTPAAADTFLFVSSRDRRLICYNRITGEHEFTRTFKAAIGGSVLIQNLKLLFQTRIPDGKFYVTQINSKHRNIERDFGPCAVTPILEANQVFLFSQNGKVTCLNPDVGFKNWQQTLDGVIEYSPVFLDPSLYVPTVKGVIFKLDAASGAVTAKRKLNGTVLGDLSTDGTYIYAGAADGRVFCLETDSLRSKWESRPGFHFFSGPVSAGDFLYLSAREGWLLKLSAKDGSLVWKTRLEGISVAAPSVTPELVFTATKSGEMAAFETGTSQRI